jgi:Ni/Co efflux regulator RcnB
MKICLSISLVTMVFAGLGSTNLMAAVAQSGHPGFQQVQYDRRPDRDDRNFRDDRDFRGGAKWRPGQVLPGQFLDRVVGDWEERGLSRLPNGHAWVRVGQQFILVRFSDRMIARILNFD